MAEQLTALEDLKSAFANFGEMSTLIDRMRNTAAEINIDNTTAAGSDDVGTQYHSTVDAPTKALTDLLQAVRDAVDSISQSGQNAATIFTTADQDALDQVSGS